MNASEQKPQDISGTKADPAGAGAPAGKDRPGPALPAASGNEQIRRSQPSPAAPESRFGVRVYPAPEPGEPTIHVAPNLLDMVTGVSITPEEAQAAKEQRDLNEVVHHMLIYGLATSTVLMLIGLALDLLLGREVPTAVPGFREVWVRVAAFRPSGFLALGLLVLIATPILRVVGSIIAFIYERDWRFAGITFLVLMIVLLSLVLGQG